MRLVLDKSEHSHVKRGNLRPNPSGDWPKVDPAAYIDQSAQIIGNVRIGYRVFVGPNAVIRADEADDTGAVEPIVIGPECNVQDGVIIHALAGSRISIEQRTSLAHGSIIHGPCTLGENCFVGFRAVLFDTNIAKGVFIGHGAVVCNVELPSHSFIPHGISIQTPEQAAKLAETGQVEKEFMKKVITTNVDLAKDYLLLNNQREE
jgi:carbonic anhydrase/acetyltransferase-like protein (isoleucine patch superfamily)